MTRIFLSYARGDDEPFVQRLYNDLTEAGYSVWLDRVSMPSRALTFLQEIRDAIAASDRLLLMVGPRAVASDYVSAEWRCALELCVAVTPVLRVGDYNMVPAELSVHHCPDARPARPTPMRCPSCSASWPSRCRPWRTCTACRRYPRTSCRGRPISPSWTRPCWSTCAAPP